MRRSPRTTTIISYPGVRVLVLALLSLCFVLPLSQLTGCAGGTRGSGLGDYQGRVLTTQQTPVEGVRVEALDSTSTPIDEDVTNAEGAFAFVVNPEDIRFLTITVGDTSSMTEAPQPEPGESVIIIIDDNDMIKEVTVEQRPTPSPTSTPMETPRPSPSPQPSPGVGTPFPPTPTSVPGTSPTAEPTLTPTPLKSPSPPDFGGGVPTHTPTPGGTVSPSPTATPTASPTPTTCFFGADPCPRVG